MARKKHIKARRQANRAARASASPQVQDEDQQPLLDHQQQDETVKISDATRIPSSPSNEGRGLSDIESLYISGFVPTLDRHIFEDPDQHTYRIYADTTRISRLDFTRWCLDLDGGEGLIQNLCDDETGRHTYEAYLTLAEAKAIKTHNAWCVRVAWCRPTIAWWYGLGYW